MLSRILILGTLLYTMKMARLLSITFLVVFIPQFKKLMNAQTFSKNILQYFYYNKKTYINPCRTHFFLLRLS